MNHRRVIRIIAMAIVPSMLFFACGRADRTPATSARNLLLITVDTLRADHIGAYGYARARTPAMDALARSGIVFERAYAAAPITLPSHATILTGRYPPGHGARDNGIRVSPTVPTLAAELRARGFKTAAFVAAFPLDHQFGLDRGFDVYSDRLGRAADGRPANERAATEVAAEASTWLSANAAQSFFVWVHFFEPHAPYAGDLSRPTIDRYDDEIAAVDRSIDVLRRAAAAVPGTLVVVAGDHGEAFGEHGEYAHSIFVYDTTLRVPLLMSGAGVPAPGAGEAHGRRIADPVTLADVAPTVMHLVGGAMKDVDGIDLTPAFSGSPLPARELYAESFAPLVEFGWAPLRSVRRDSWKFVAAPTPELYNLATDPDERSNVAAGQPATAASLDARVARYSPAALPPSLSLTENLEAAARLRALGYVGASGAGGRGGSSGAPRPDPKDRREIAARIAQVTSGELVGPALVSALDAIVRDDPRNGQAHLRLGYALLEAGDCARAEPELAASVANGLPSADAFLGIATCRGRRQDLKGAEHALAEAQRLEPGNPVIVANIGILQGAKGDLPKAIASFQSALASDPDLHEARFNLAIAYAKSGRRAEAAAEARTLLSRLPPSAPQRPEIERLLRQLQ
jgi:choline-sulfatase